MLPEWDNVTATLGGHGQFQEPLHQRFNFNPSIRRGVPEPSCAPSSGLALDMLSDCVGLTRVESWPPTPRLRAA